MIFGKKIRKQVRDLALLNLEEEICGVIYFDGIELKIAQCKNISECKKHNYILNPKEFLKYSLLGEIIGIFHSHVVGTTKISLPDEATLNGHNLKLLIYALKEDKFEEYEPKGYKSPYLGREFIWGKQDCLSLIIDYYNNEKNINLIDPFSNRNSKIFDIIKHGWNFDDNKDAYNKYNFKKIADKYSDNIKLQKDDLLLIKKDGANFATHAAIYLDGNRILHQPRDYYSLIEELNENIKSKIVEILRLC